MGADRASRSGGEIVVKYLLDTCIPIEVFRGQAETIAWLSQVPPKEVALSSVTVMELEAGLSYATVKVEEKREQLRRFLSVYEVLDFSAVDAREAGKALADLKKKGRMIGAYDVQIAGVGLARELTVVTRNTKEFKRVKGLEIFCPN